VKQFIKAKHYKSNSDKTCHEEHNALFLYGDVYGDSRRFASFAKSLFDKQFPFKHPENTTALKQSSHLFASPLSSDTQKQQNSSITLPEQMLKASVEQSAHLLSGAYEVISYSTLSSCRS
jgi:hypothetical protein